MLGENNYTREYINACRLKVDADIENYNRLIAIAKDEHITNELLDAAIASFEAVFFNNMLLVLDGYFVQRSGGIAQKDSNPLTEVRALCQSIMHNNNKMGTDNNIEIDAATSVLKYKPGDKIKLNETDFIKLSKAFLDEIESKYVEK